MQVCPLLYFLTWSHRNNVEVRKRELKRWIILFIFCSATCHISKIPRSPISRGSMNLLLYSSLDKELIIPSGWIMTRNNFQFLAFVPLNWQQVEITPNCYRLSHLDPAPNCATPSESQSFSVLVSLSAKCSYYLAVKFTRFLRKIKWVHDHENSYKNMKLPTNVRNNGSYDDGDNERECRWELCTFMKLHSVFVIGDFYVLGHPGLGY